MINRLVRNGGGLLNRVHVNMARISRFEDIYGMSVGLSCTIARHFSKRLEELQPNSHYLRRIRVEEKREKRADDKIHLRFKSLGVGTELEQYLEKIEVYSPTPIQTKIIPIIMNEKKKNLFVGAQTGSGKTLAYLLPIFEEIKRQEKELGMVKGATLSMRPKAMIICPSKELVHQVALVAKDISHHCRLKVTKLCNDQEYRTEREKLIEGVDIVIGTFKR